MKNRNIKHYVRSLRARFNYKSDSKNRDRWSILARTGLIFGDCEDWCLTLLRDRYGAVAMWIALARGEAKMHYCTIKGAGHAVVEIDGLLYDCNNGKGWGWDNQSIKRKGYKYGYAYSVNTVAIKVFGKIGYVAIAVVAGALLAATASLITYQII